MGSKSLDQKVAIVTGSTSGIGRLLAENLHSRGYKVAVSGRRLEEGQAIAASFDPTGATAFFTQCDVSSYQSHSALFKAVWDKWGRLDTYIANAGVIDQDSKYNFGRRDAPVEQLPPEPDTTCSDVEYKAVIHGTALATHFMRNNPGVKGGKIIVTGSIAAIFPLPIMPEHCAAKAAVLQYVRTMAPLLKVKEDITINIILPCGVDTPAMPNFAEAFLPEHLTLPACLLTAFNVFLTDEANERTGMAVEAAHDEMFFHDVPDYKSGGPSMRAALVYEPWFQYLHGEKSDLDNALQGPPSRN
ncbi:unnamed protein product [Discula destructiva]